MSFDFSTKSMLNILALPLIWWHFDHAVQCAVYKFFKYVIEKNISYTVSHIVLTRVTYIINSIITL